MEQQLSYLLFWRCFTWFQRNDSRCYVVAGTGVDHVTNCSFSVEVWGTGFSLLERYIVNNNTMNVAGKWKCLQSGFVNVVTPQYSVSLF